MGSRGDINYEGTIIAYFTVCVVQVWGGKLDTLACAVHARPCARFAAHLEVISPTTLLTSESVLRRICVHCSVHCIAVLELQL